MKIDKYVERFGAMTIAVFAGIFITHGMIPEALTTLLIAILMSSGVLFKGLEKETKK